MGKGGPLIVIKLVLPGLVGDAGAALPRWSLPETARGVILGAAAGASDFFPAAAFELLAGVPVEIVVQHAALSAGGKAAFGALGGWAAVVIIRRLRDHGIIGETAAPEK
jgi:hypothetical protein